MDNNKLIVFVKGLLVHNNIILSKKSDNNLVINQMVTYLDALIFNIVSIACIISIINSSTKINKENLPIIRSYIEDKCNFKYKKSKISGGAVNCASFYGAKEPMYSENNLGNDILGVNWSTGIIRPEIGSNPQQIQSGGGKKHISKVSYNYIILHIKKVLKYHSITASKNIIHELVSIIDHHIKCLIINIKNCNKELSLKCLNKIINKNKILAPLK